MVDMTHGSPVLGTLTASFNNVHLFPGLSGFNSSGSGFVSFDLGSANAAGDVSVNLTSFDLTIAGVLDVNVGPVVITPGQTTIASIAGATAEPVPRSIHTTSAASGFGSRGCEAARM